MQQKIEQLPQEPKITSNKKISRGYLIFGILALLFSEFSHYLIDLRSATILIVTIVGILALIFSLKNSRLKKSLRIILWVPIIIFSSILIVSWVMPMDHFACSDYCPPRPGGYIVRVFPAGEINPVLCRLIGGKPWKFYGWGEFSVCELE